MVYRRIFKQGNSIVFAVPAYMVNDLGMQIGDYFGIEVVAGPVMKLTPASFESVRLLSLRDREAAAAMRLSRGGGGGGGRALESEGASGAQSEVQTPPKC